MTADQAIKTITDFAELFKITNDKVATLYDEVGNTDFETQDLLHEFELSPLDGYYGYKLAKFTKEVRQRRRLAKNEQEIFKVIQAFKQAHGKLMIDLFKLENSLKNIRSCQQNKKYVCRIRRDLKISRAGGNNAVDINN